MELYQTSEELSLILIDIAVIGCATNLMGFEPGANILSIETIHKLLKTSVLPDITSRALIVLMNITPSLFPLGFDDPTLKPHLSKFTSEELEFVKEHNAGNWKMPTVEFKEEADLDEGVDISLTPPAKSRSFCRFM